MKNLTLLSCAVLSTALLVTSCKKNDTSTLVKPEISFGINADNAVSNLGSALNKDATVSGTASLTWTSGIANIAHFKLEAKRNDHEVEINTKNLTNVDLFAIHPLLESVTIDTGTYKEIEIKVIFLKSTTADIPLTLKGTYTTSGGAIIPIEFYLNDEAKIKVEAENVVVDGTKDIHTTLSMHLNQLLTGITPQQIDSAPRTNNILVISNTVNTDLYDIIKDNLDSCGDSDGFEESEKSEREKHD